MLSTRIPIQAPCPLGLPEMLTVAPRSLVSFLLPSGARARLHAPPPHGLPAEAKGPDHGGPPMLAVHLPVPWLSCGLRAQGQVLLRAAKGLGRQAPRLGAVRSLGLV